MFTNFYLLLAIIFYFTAYFYYLNISHGLGNKATYLQLRRFIPCAILAVLPSASVNFPISEPLFFIPAIICYLWIFTYPTLYYISNHKVSSDFEFHFEAVFGLYLIAWISALGILFKQISFFSIPLTITITIVEFLLLLIPIAQLAYFGLYKACINENGMQMLQETHYNEIIEFFKSMPWYLNLGTAAIIIAVPSIVGYYNFSSLRIPITISNYALILNGAVAIFLTTYLWKKNHGVFIRTAIVEFYLDIKEYLDNNKLYTKNLQQRYKDLEVVHLAESSDKPSTILLVIGESASRDYMKAFNSNYQYDTTPWLSSQKNNKNFILFPHSYSIAANTDIAVSNALTEMNQYNNKKFYESCAIVDIAHKLDYKVYWYSNQGHLGSADTPVTLIADTADVAKWTKQKLNQVQYDTSLISYLDEIDSTKNNFVVIHLKGNHFNFINRYPKEYTKFGTPGKYDLELNYADSIAFTDSVLSQIFDYAKDKLNLQAMIYFSDHATIPDKRRSPNFEGLASVRIPLFTYFTDEYIAKNEFIVKNLREHSEYYWTNDLAYELLCSIFNISSNRFDEANSIASNKFKYKREDLLTNNGKSKV